eukprot:1078014-Karenia_brevis.AAC.1
MAQASAQRNLFRSRSQSTAAPRANVHERRASTGAQALDWHRVAELQAKKATPRRQPHACNLMLCANLRKGAMRLIMFQEAADIHGLRGAS